MALVLTEAYHNSEISLYNVVVLKLFLYFLMVLSIFKFLDENLER